MRSSITVKHLRVGAVANLVQPNVFQWYSFPDILQHSLIIPLFSVQLLCTLVSCPVWGDMIVFIIAYIDESLGLESLGFITFASSQRDNCQLFP
jgi:hypothetical protein